MDWFLLQCLLAILCIAAGFVLGNRRASPLNASAKSRQEQMLETMLQRIDRMDERVQKLEKGRQRRKSRSGTVDMPERMFDISPAMEEPQTFELPSADEETTESEGSSVSSESQEEAEEAPKPGDEALEEPGMRPAALMVKGADAEALKAENGAAGKLEKSMPDPLLSVDPASLVNAALEREMQSPEEVGDSFFTTDEVHSSDSYDSDNLVSSDEGEVFEGDSPMGLRRSASRTLDHDYHSSPKRTVFKKKKLSVSNKTSFDIYTAVYDKLRVKLSDCRRISKTYLVASGDTIQLPKPSTNTSRSRHLIFSRSESNFSEESSTMTSAMFKTMPSFNLTFTDSCVVTYDDSTGLKGYSMQKWKARSRRTDTQKRRRAPSIRTPISRLKHSAAGSSQNRLNPYREVAATVRQGTDLCVEEQAFLSVRRAQTKAAIEELLGESLDDEHVPTIAFAGSGGGCRAMMSTLGSLVGLESAGLIDTLTYVAGVSGSTWSIALWQAMGGSLADLRENVIHKFTSQNMTKPGAKTLAAFKSIMKQKFAFNLGSMSLIDLYGAHLATCFFRDTEPAGQNLCLSHQALKLVNATMPMPIYTAVQTAVEGHYDWWEFTPAEIGSETYGWVPSWGFGREYKGGLSVNFAPEPCLGVLLGTFGSAFCAPLGRVTVEFFETLETSENVKGIKQKLLEKKDSVTDKVNRSALSRAKLIQPAKFSNFAHDPTQEASKQRKRKVALCDAGIDINLPFPPLLRKERKVDIIIACNASKTPNISDHLALLRGSEWARSQGIPFFDGDVSKAYDQAACILDPLEVGGPLIVYLPLKAHQEYKNGFDPQLNQKQGGYCGTFNFDYSREQIEELSGLTEFAMANDGKAKIVEAIKKVVAHKRGL